MPRRAASWAAVVVLLAASWAGAQGDRKPGKKVRVLFITESAGWNHAATAREGDKLSVAEENVVRAARESGLFEVECSKDSREAIKPERLATTALILSYTSGHIQIMNQLSAIDNWVKRGGAFMGVHSTIDVMGGTHLRMLDGGINDHPWGEGTPVCLTIHDPEHPATRALGAEFRLAEEVYDFKHFEPEKVRVLYSLTMTQVKPQRPLHVPVAWVRDHGQGRIFYTTLGHSPSTWTNAPFLQHLLDTMRWMLRMEQKGESVPNPDVSAVEHAKAFLAVEGAPLGNMAVQCAMIDARFRKQPAWGRSFAAQVEQAGKLAGRDRLKALQKVLASISKK